MLTRAAGVILGLVVLLGVSPPPDADRPPILVFAAASLTESMQEIGKGFEQMAGTRVQFSFGASSDLARQIEAGAPADAFFSADTGKMDALEKSGKVRKEDRRQFLGNELVVIVPAGAAVTPKSAADLGKLPKIALADPQGVPGGVYAKKWLESAGVWKDIEPKVVPTLDVRAVLAAVETEAAPAGVVYSTDAAISKGVRVAFEVTDGPTITYSLARVAASKNPASAAFVEYASSASGRGVFQKHGFVVR